ncbi:hypothetical protein QAD02_010075 [Eretmocerus hayati]|uniref:Uncharacterized protein n=1 Tax=Eretmocerus hayati TaxID=131215 RepID=A0ACC2NDL5_9HYME|nr:hypothetical protein QAD02_010075 [Eretmocerus hayati]
MILHIFHEQKRGQWKEDLKHQLNETMKTELKQIIEDAIEYEADECLREIDSCMVSKMECFDKRCLRSGRGRIFGQQCYDNFMKKLSYDIKSIVKRAQKCMGTENKNHDETTTLLNPTAYYHGNKGSWGAWNVGNADDESYEDNNSARISNLILY